MEAGDHWHYGSRIGILVIRATKSILNCYMVLIPEETVVFKNLVIFQIFSRERLDDLMSKFHFY
jgi:hypothetical protein